MRGSIDWCRARTKQLALMAGIAGALVVPALAPSVSSAHPRLHPAHHVARVRLIRYFGHKVG